VLLKKIPRFLRALYMTFISTDYPFFLLSIGPGDGVRRPIDVLLVLEKIRFWYITAGKSTLRFVVFF